jgi:hypothetical protein
MLLLLLLPLLLPLLTPCSSHDKSPRACVSVSANAAGNPHVAAVVVAAVLMLDPSDTILLFSESFTAVHRLGTKRLLQAKPSNTDVLRAP